MDVIEYIKKSIGLYFGKVEEGYKYIDKKISWQEAFMTIYVMNILIQIIGTIMQYTFLPDEFSLYNTEFGGYYILIMLISTIVFTPLVIFIGNAILHLFLKLFKGTAKYTDTLKFSLSLGVFSNLIGLFLALISPLTELSNNVIITTIYGLIVFVFIIVMLIWILIVFSKTFSLVHKISKGSAIGALLVMMACVIVIGLTFGIIMFLLINYIGAPPIV